MQRKLNIHVHPQELAVKRFIAIYTASPAAMSRWESHSESERAKRQAAGIAAWHKWVADNAAAIVEVGGPLSRTKLVGTSGISDIRNNMTAFTIVQAESQDAAARLFVNHPHFTFFPGEGVEVMECLPVPTA
jgi:hypothetical protein